MKDHNKPFIVAASRTPMGQFNGCFKNTPAPVLGAIAIQGLIPNRLSTEIPIDQVIMGCVLSAGLGQAPARQASLLANLPVSTPCVTINKMCGSGMQSVIQACDAISAGSSRAVIAGGIENMTQAPYLLKKARDGYRLGSGTLFDHMMLDGLEDAYQPGKPMGYFAEECAEMHEITREQQDAFALASLERALQAHKLGYFKNEINPVVVKDRKNVYTIETDENPTRAKPDKIPTLKPVFKENGTITAANASSIADGAATVLVASSSFTDHHGLKPMAKIVAHHTHAHEPAWFTTAPITAIKEVIQKANWSLGDVDLFEINEAFAVVTLAAMKSLKLPHEKINVNGGACALGHPIGASGARIIVTLVHAMQQRGLKKGVAALCIGGGEATALAIEMI